MRSGDEQNAECAQYTHTDRPTRDGWSDQAEFTRSKLNLQWWYEINH